MHVVGRALALKMEKEMAPLSRILSFNFIHLFVFCCAGSSLLCMDFSPVAAGGSTLVVMHKLLTAVVSPGTEHRL